MPRYQSEEYYGAPTTDRALDLLDRQGARQREQMRYAGEDTARSIAQTGQMIGQAIGNAPSAYLNAKRLMLDAEEGQVRMADAKRKQEELAEENSYLDTVDETTGLSNRQKMRQFKMEENQLALDLKKSQIAESKADAYAKLHPGFKPESMADVKSKIDVAAPLFASADTPEKKAAAVANAKKLGLTEAQIAAAEGAQLASTSGGKASDTAKKSGAFANKAMVAHDIANQMESPEYGYEPGSYRRALRDLPGIGKVTKTDDDRKYENAQDEFVTALIRDESGSNAPPAEIEKYKSIYFPTPGDSADVVEQKRAARQRAIEGMYAKSGGTADPAKVELYKLAPKKGSTAGQAMAAPASAKKPVGEMTIEEMEAELRGGK